jgi:hypothetical protein
MYQKRSLPNRRWRVENKPSGLRFYLSNLQKILRHDPFSNKLSQPLQCAIKVARHPKSPPPTYRALLGERGFANGATFIPKLCSAWRSQHVVYSLLPVNSHTGLPFLSLVRTIRCFTAPPNRLSQV